MMFNTYKNKSCIPVISLIACLRTPLHAAFSAKFWRKVIPFPGRHLTDNIFSCNTSAVWSDGEFILSKWKCWGHSLLCCIILFPSFPTYSPSLFPYYLPSAYCHPHLYDPQSLWNGNEKNHIGSLFASKINQKCTRTSEMCTNQLEQTRRHVSGTFIGSKYFCCRFAFWKKEDQNINNTEKNIVLWRHVVDKAMQMHGWQWIVLLSQYKCWAWKVFDVIKLAENPTGIAYIIVAIYYYSAMHGFGTGAKTEDWVSSLSCCLKMQWRRRSFVSCCCNILLFYLIDSYFTCLAVT